METAVVHAQWLGSLKSRFQACSILRCGTSLALRQPTHTHTHACASAHAPVHAVVCIPLHQPDPLPTQGGGRVPQNRKISVLWTIKGPGTMQKKKCCKILYFSSKANPKILLFKFSTFFCVKNTKTVQNVQRATKRGGKEFCTSRQPTPEENYRHC